LAKSFVKNYTCSLYPFLTSELMELLKIKDRRVSAFQENKEE
jgi:hypothetical protein